MNVNQAPHHAPDEPVARVLALVEGEGYSVPAAAELVGVNPNTAQKWVQQAREVTQGNKPILDRWHRRVSKSLDLMQRGLDYIEEDPSDERAFKSLQTLNIIAGTGTDKLQKQQEIEARERQTQVAHSLSDAISRLAQLDTSNLARIIDAEYSVVPAEPGYGLQVTLPAPPAGEKEPGVP